MTATVPERSRPAITLRNLGVTENETGHVVIERRTALGNGIEIGSVSETETETETEIAHVGTAIENASEIRIETERRTEIGIGNGSGRRIERKIGMVVIENETEASAMRRGVR